MKIKKMLVKVLSAALSVYLAAGCQISTFAATTANTATSQKTAVAAAPEKAKQSIFKGGSGTIEDPYLIGNKAQFEAFRNSVNNGSKAGYAKKYIKLVADIDLAGENWEPIGNMNDMKNHTTMFLGSFDGGGHTISNLKFESDEPVCGAGLFGINCGEIKNITVENAVVTVKNASSNAVGGVVGYNMMGNVSHVTLKGNSTITGINCTGGIIGGNMGNVSYCNADHVKIVVLGDNDFSKGLVQADIAECGGLIIGGGFGGNIDSCKATGTIKADGKEAVGIGGIGGCLEMMDTISNCSADVTIELKNGGHAIGGLCGYAGTHSNPNIVLESEGISTKNHPSQIKDCHAKVNIKADGATHIGGLVGTGLYYYGEETTFAISDCTVTGKIEGAITPGSIAGRAEGCQITNCTSDLTIDGVKATSQIGKTTCKYESADQ